MYYLTTWYLEYSKCVSAAVLCQNTPKLSNFDLQEQIICMY
jgi:hypothetical protein